MSALSPPPGGPRAEPPEMFQILDHVSLNLLKPGPSQNRDRLKTGSVRLKKKSPKVMLSVKNDITLFLGYL